MATIKQTLTLKHQANLGEDVEEITFQEGDEIVVQTVWADSYLCKNDAGLLFNIPKDCVER